MKATVKFDGEHSGAVLAKQLFLWDKKNKEKMYLISADVDLTLGMKDVAKMVGVKPDNFRFVDVDVTFNVLGCR